MTLELSPPDPKAPSLSMTGTIMGRGGGRGTCSGVNGPLGGMPGALVGGKGNGREMKSVQKKWVRKMRNTQEQGPLLSVRVRGQRRLSQSLSRWTPVMESHGTENRSGEKRPGMGWSWGQLLAACGQPGGGEP